MEISFSPLTNICFLLHQYSRNLSLVNDIICTSTAPKSIQEKKCKNEQKVIYCHEEVWLSHTA